MKFLICLEKKGRRFDNFAYESRLMRRNYSICFGGITGILSKSHLQLLVASGGSGTWPKSEGKQTETFQAESPGLMAPGIGQNRLEL